MLSQLRDIADRYLKRTLGDAEQLQVLVVKALGGDGECVKQSEQLAHKIHGSGAMFGFDALSEYAGRIERLVAQHAADLNPVASELSALAKQLLQAVHAAAVERGVDD